MRVCKKKKKTECKWNVKKKLKEEQQERWKENYFWHNWGMKKMDELSLLHLWRCIRVSARYQLGCLSLKISIQVQSDFCHWEKAASGFPDCQSSFGDKAGKLLFSQKASFEQETFQRKLVESKTQLWSLSLFLCQSSLGLSFLLSIPFSICFKVHSSFFLLTFIQSTSSFPKSRWSMLNKAQRSKQENGWRGQTRSNP